MSEVPNEGTSAEEAARAVAPNLPSIKVTFPSGKNGKSAPKVEGEDLLKGIARTPGAAWSVTRVSVPSEYHGATTGLLPVTFSGKEFASPTTLHDRLGAGVYEFASGDKKYVVELATKKPPVEFGGEEEESEMLVQTPVGPQVVRMPRAVPPALNPYAYGAVAPWSPSPAWGAPAAPSAADVAKAVAEANRPLTDALVKIMERLDKDRDGASAAMIQMKQLELAVAKEERLAREKEAEEARRAKEAELKTLREIENLKAEKAADAQVQIAKAQSEAQRESSRAQLEAARESAKAAVEAAKETARSAVETAKERAAHEREFMERMLEAQRPAEDPLETLKKYRDAFGPPVDGGGSGIGGALLSLAPSLVKTIGEELRALKATTANVVVVGPDGQPVGQSVAALPAPAAAPAPTAPPPAGPDPNETQRKRKELMDAVATFRAGFEQRRSAAEVAGVLAARAPTVYAWMRAADPLALLKQLDELLERPEFSEGEKATARATKAALGTDEGVAWALGVFAAARGNKG